MTQPQIEIQLICALTAAACAIPGVFLVLRRAALLSDAISHAILPGIVVGFFLSGSLSSPLIIGMAAVAGVLTVALIEGLERTRLVKTDAAIGLVFPALFSIGVILIARYAGDVHLDTDAVLLGEPAFAWIERWMPGGRDWGPLAAWLMGGVLVANLLFVSVFFKELKLSTFDAALAASLGFSPVVLHYALMALVSTTAVGAFDVVGSILVVALMIGPPAAAYLLTDRLGGMIAWAIGLGVASAVGGYWMSRWLDASIAGSMATMTGLVFLLVYLVAPDRGLWAQARRRTRRRLRFARQMLAVHLLHHERTPEAPVECRVGHLQEHLRWDAARADRVVRSAEKAGWAVRRGDLLRLTDAGRAAAQEAMTG